MLESLEIKITERFHNHIVLHLLSPEAVIIGPGDETNDNKNSQRL